MFAIIVGFNEMRIKPQGIGEPDVKITLPLDQI